MDPHSICQILLNANPQSLTILVVILLFLLIISFFVSGAEVALFSLSGKDFNMLKTKQHVTARRILSLLEQPRQVHATLLITNLFVNLGIIVLSSIILDEMVQLELVFWAKFGIKFLAIGFLVILFGEVLPRTWAAQNPIRFAYQSSLMVEVLHSLLKGLSAWTVQLANRMDKGLGGDDQAYDLEKDLNKDMGSSEEEKQMLKGIMKFGHITVRQIMRTRLDVSGINHASKFHEVLEQVRDLHYSRLPVYKNSLDEVVGIIHTKDLLPYLDQENSFDWHTLMRAPYFVHELKLIEDLLQEFRSRGIHFAVVVDEFGGTEGIVTLEDIVEEITGEIKDEFDEEDLPSQMIDEKTFLFEGKTSITEACRVMRLSLDTFDQVKGESESMAGLVLELAGRIPDQGTELPCGDFKLTVEDVNRNRIQKVKVEINV